MGLIVAVPIGPLGLLCIRRTLAGGIGAGLSTGAGGASVHVGYAAVAILGLNSVTQWVQLHRAAFDLLAACLLAAFTVRLLRRDPAPAAAAPTFRSVRHNYVSAAAFDAMNPLTVVLMTGAATALEAEQRVRVLLVLAGVCAGRWRGGAR